MNVEIGNYVEVVVGGPGPDIDHGKVVEALPNGRFLIYFPSVDAKIEFGISPNGYQNAGITAVVDGSMGSGVMIDVSTKDTKYEHTGSVAEECAKRGY